MERPIADTNPWKPASDAASEPTSPRYAIGDPEIDTFAESVLWHYNHRLPLSVGDPVKPWRLSDAPALLPRIRRSPI
jgi:hypothetical protein